MRNWTCVTTCNADGWNVYGKQMFESWLRHWKAPGLMRFYAEGFDVPPYDQDKAICCNLPQWLWDFIDRNAGSPKARGMFGGGYNFKFDAIRFAFKTAAVIDSAESRVWDWIAWIDADCVFHADVTDKMLETLVLTSREDGLLPSLAWLDREMMYPECGFYIMDLCDRAVRDMIAEWKSLYLTDRLFELKEWHDSYVLEQVAKNTPHLRIGSLSGASGRKTTHPAINGPISSFLDHKKGPRKTTGRTPKKERRIRDGNPYWS